MLVKGKNRIQSFYWFAIVLRAKSSLLYITVLMPFAFGLLTIASATDARAQQNGQGGVIVDQLVALVNEDVITRSDLLWGLALDPKQPDPAGPISSDILQRALDSLVEQRLIAQEANRLPAADVTQEEIAERRRRLIAQFPSEAVFRQRVESVGLTSRRIDAMIRQMVLIERFVEFRFKSFVLVTEADIQKYYDEKFAPQMRNGGQVPPALDQKINGATVREHIREILRQERINEEIDRWMKNARQRAEIVMLAEV